MVVVVMETSLLPPVSGPVGTFFYTSPEMLDPLLQRKVTQVAILGTLACMLRVYCHVILSASCHVTLFASCHVMLCVSCHVMLCGSHHVVCVEG